jgi:hypothetical protein
VRFWHRAAGAFLLAAVWGSASAVACDLDSAKSTQWRVVRDRGVAWLQDPCGKLLQSLGVDIVDGGASGANVDHPHYDWRRFAPSLPAWERDTRARLLSWDFNSAGAWSLPPQELRMPTTINLELGRLARFHWFDPFDPATTKRMFSEAVRLTAPYRGTPYRIGYFSDNEVGWWSGALFLFFSQKPASNHTKQRWVALMRQLYKDDWRHFTGDFVPPPGVASWRALLEATAPTHLAPGGNGMRAVHAWTAVVARHYYEVAAGAIHKADPDALYFGDRLPIYYDPDAVRAEAAHVDALAVNYDVDSPEGWIAPYFFDGLRRLTGGKPVLVSEWFYAAQENRSGNRNNGHLMTVKTQDQRAKGAASAEVRFASIPELVGLHWFQYYDYPSGGRADGEDYDFGLVDINDHPYERLVAALTATNRDFPALHRSARDSPHQRAMVLPQARIDPAPRSLLDWPKPASLLPSFKTPAGEVPFGEAYLAWNEEGLALAHIGQDYYDPDLLAYDGAFPLSESYHVALDIDAGAGPHRFVLYVVPPPRGGDGGNMSVRLCEVPYRHDGEKCLPVPGADALYLGADQPRVVATMRLPWHALGLDRPPKSRKLRLEISARSWDRGRWMSLTGLPPELGSADPARWLEAHLR